jgi:hypothetical protein
LPYAAAAFLSLVPPSAAAGLCRSEIEKLEPSPFKTAFIERSRLSSLLSKYYGNSYIGAINPDSGR